MLFRRFFSSVFIALLLISSFSLYALTLEQLQQKLMNQDLVRGEFLQSKTLKIFDQPLISQGQFLLSHQQGLIWQQQNPFPVLLVLANNKLSQQFADQTPEVIESKDNPMVFYFSHLFLSLFKGDLNALNDQFELTLNSINKRWVLNLQPKSAPLNNIFSTIEIQGIDQIDKLTLIELNGDTTTISFTNISDQPMQLSEQEKDVFTF